jgi:hypothetical protein
LMPCRIATGPVIVANIIPQRSHIVEASVPIGASYAKSIERCMR